MSPVGLYGSVRSIIVQGWTFHYSTWLLVSPIGTGYWAAWTTGMLYDPWGLILLFHCSLMLALLCWSMELFLISTRLREPILLCVHARHWYSGCSHT